MGQLSGALLETLQIKGENTERAPRKLWEKGKGNRSDAASEKLWPLEKKSKSQASTCQVASCVPKGRQTHLYTLKLASNRQDPILNTMTKNYSNTISKQIHCLGTLVFGQLFWKPPAINCIAIIELRTKQMR